MKFLFVTGSVMSGLGKGITISSIGVLLQSCGLRVTAVKIDPYLNCDAGTMSPYEHGECFVLDDGGETDLDLGNYERFLGVSLTSDHNVTTGKVYDRVIRAERRGDYLGQTVQVVPHVTDAVMEWIERAAQAPVDGGDAPPDLCLVEVGGTVGDIESMVFLEALRQLQRREGCAHVHVSLVPTSEGEQKTKPAQHGVKALRAIGLPPDVVACRCEAPLDAATRGKLALFCDVSESRIVSLHDAPNVWRVPAMLREQGVHNVLGERLGLELPREPELGPWDGLCRRSEAAARLPEEAAVRVAIVGKYTRHGGEAYKSVVKALEHAAVHIGAGLRVVWIEASELAEPGAERPWALLRGADALLVPGGFGERGFEGMCAAVAHARTSGLPFLGICLGMQCAVVEYARGVLGWAGANSTEFDEATPHPVVVHMPEIRGDVKGGNMRLGARATAIAEPSVAASLYGAAVAVERHRHRYEVNPGVVAELERAGLRFAGRDRETGERMETAELPPETHPFFFGCQYHPEFTSRPHTPSPPFLGLLRAAAERVRVGD